MKAKIGERILHALLYEFFALLLCTPLFAFIMKVPMEEMGALNIAISVTAIVWNMLFNAAYERLIVRFHLSKTIALRVLHAISFEVGLGLMVIPLSAVWLKISLWEALLLDTGILLFFLPYSFIFNWTYDATKAALKNASAKRRSTG